MVGANVVTFACEVVAESGDFGILAAFVLESEEAKPASLSRVLSVDGATPMPSCVPNWNEGDEGGSIAWGASGSAYEIGGPRRGRCLARIGGSCSRRWGKGLRRE